MFWTKRKNKNVGNREKVQKRRLLCETLEVRQLMAADAVAAWTDVQEQPLLGETMEVGLQFSNAGLATGYGPYVDLIVPRGSDGDEGIQYVGGSAEYLDSKLRETVLEFDNNGLAQHPFAVDANGKPLVLSGNAGDQLVVVELPFGSFVPGQPAVEVAVQLSIGRDAEIGQSMEVVSASGFRFGNDPLDNVSADPMVRGQNSTLEVTPGLVRTRIEYLGPEDETATGRNFIRSYRVDVDIAEGAVIDNLSLTNLFDNSQAFLELRDVSWGDALNVLGQPESGLVSQDTRLELGLDNLIGHAGVDGSYVVDFFVPDFDAEGNWTADPILGTDGESTFKVHANGVWEESAATDVAAANKVVFSSIPATHALEEQVIAVQQSVMTVEDINTKGLGPGDKLEYTIDFQVSDYASVLDLVLKTTVPDGQRLLEDEAVTFTISGVNGYSDAFVKNSEAGLGIEGPSKQVGSLDYFFNVSSELELHGLTGKIH